MKFRNWTSINKIKMLKRYQKKALKNRMRRNKMVNTQKKIIKLMTQMKKLKSTWKVWTKLKMTRWDKKQLIRTI
jgi:hypothetical protein